MRGMKTSNRSLLGTTLVILLCCVVAILATSQVARADVIQLSCMRMYPQCSDCSRWSLTLNTTNGTATFIPPGGYQESGAPLTTALSVSASTYTYIATLHFASSGSPQTITGTLNRATLIEVDQISGGSQFTYQCSLSHNQI